MGWNPFREIYDDFSNGNIGTGILDLGTGGIYSAAKDAYESPFNQQKAGLDDIAARAAQLKQERIARQQATLQQSLAALKPARDALHAVYGDPSSWSL